MKLSIELVPKTCWYTNVRSHVPKEEWDRLRRDCYRKADYKCEVCESKGSNHPVECHEVWEYNDITQVQRLVRLIALCPKCHQVKHFGYWRQKGKEKQIRKHLMKINKMTLAEVDNYIEVVGRLYWKRSRITWILDISILATL